MATCTGELSTLAPTITSCPGNNELVLFCNVSGQQGGYAFRSWSTLQACITAAIKFMFQQFTIGQGGSPMNPGESALTLNFSSLNIKGILQDSVFITLAGPELPRENTDQLSYGVVYNPTNVVINFLAPVQSGQLYILHYAYTS